jgi:hypothetical protein
MKSNPALRKLGYSQKDRLVIIHADDIGMCHASLEAYSGLIEFGLISSGATMVPCPWFPSVASLCRKSSDIDMGVHLTLTSEWDAYRWKPLSTSDSSSGLIDEEGYFYRTTEEAQQYANVDAVRNEINKQVDQAINAGINITHIDTHMNSIAHPKFIADYVGLAIRVKTPFLFPRKDEAGFQQLGMSQEIASIASSYVEQLEDNGMPLVDHVTGLYLDQPKNRLDQAKKAFSALLPGITHFIIHPSIDTPELRAITPDWYCRLEDFKTFMDESLRTFINGLGLYIISYQSLKQLITF